MALVISCGRGNKGVTVSGLGSIPKFWHVSALNTWIKPSSTPSTITTRMTQRTKRLSPSTSKPIVPTISKSWTDDGPITDDPLTYSRPSTLPTVSVPKQITQPCVLSELTTKGTSTYWTWNG